jgi:hypothetical protein
MRGWSGSNARPADYDKYGPGGGRKRVGEFAHRLRELEPLT